MAQVSGGTLVVTLEGRDVNLTDLLTKVENQMQRGATTAKNFDTTLESLTATQKRNESAIAAYAQSQARFAEASGNSNLAIARLVSALQELTPNTAAANNVLTQLQGTLNRQATAATQAAQAQLKASQELAAAHQAENAAFQNKASFITNAAGSFQQLIGAYFAATQAAQLFSAAISAGNQLEKAETTLKALSGNVENYEKNISAAREQQSRFGGSLQDNIEGLSGFANIAKRTGIDIKDLANEARALAIIDPAQGFKGASIALKEFFSGDITSLARRFEIPRDRLNELKELAQTDAPAAFQKLKAVLDEFGISQSLLTEQANTTAVTYDKLSGSAADAFAAIGQGMAKILAGPAQQLTAELQKVADGINQLNQSGKTKLSIEEQMLSASNSAAEFNARVVGANDQITQSFQVTNAAMLQTMPIGGQVATIFEAIGNAAIGSSIKFQQLNDAQFAFAQNALAAGTSLKDVQTTLGALDGAFENLRVRFASVGEASGFTAAQLNTFQGAMLVAASASAEGATFAQALANAVLAGSISIDDATIKLQGYATGIAQTNALHAEAAGVTASTSQAIQILNTELSDNAEKALISANNTAQLKDLQAELANIAGAVASGHTVAGDAALAMASKYNIAASAASKLISLQLQLAGLTAGGIPKSALRRGQEGGLSSSNNGRPPAQEDVDVLKANARFLENQKRLTEQQRQADLALARAKGDVRTQIDLLRASQKGLNKDSAEFKNIEAQIISIEKAASKKAGGASGAKSPKLTANEKLNNQLLSQQDKFDNQMEDLEASHQKKLLDIVTEFAKRQLEVQRENEVLKRRSRFDFYSDLNKSNIAPVDKQKFSAAYEEAFKRAQEIAQSGRAKLSQEFLKLKQDHIQQLKELAQEEADIRSDKDLSKGEKDSRLKDLEARRKLLEDAQREEEKQLLEGGDKIQNEFNQRVADENKAYSDQADKIITAADRAGEAKVRNAERSKIKVDEENKSLADQYEQYRKIANLNGGTLPAQDKPTTTNIPDTGTPGQPAPVTATQPLPIKTDTPLAVQASEALIVKQFELFVVRDQGVIDALGDQTIRLEGKLDILSKNIGDLSTTLSGKLDSIRNAVGSNTVKAVIP